MCFLYDTQSLIYVQLLQLFATQKVNEENANKNQKTTKKKRAKTKTKEINNNNKNETKTLKKTPTKPISMKVAIFGGV